MKILINCDGAGVEDIFFVRCSYKTSLPAAAGLPASFLLLTQRCQGRRQRESLA